MIGILLALGAFAALAVAVGTRRGRETAIGCKLIEWMRIMRLTLWELPLRAITGRRRPDCARIKLLQRTVDLPLADLIAKAERDAERECAPSLAHGTKTSGLSFANAEITALTLASAGYDPADVLAAVHPEHGYRGAMDYWTQEAASASAIELEPKRDTAMTGEQGPP